MTKKIKSSYDKLVESFSPERLKRFETDYQELLLSELILAIMEQDDVSVRKLAKAAGISPTVIQGLRSGSKKNYSMVTFYKVLTSLGFDQFMVGHNNQFIPIDLSSLNNKK